MYRLCVCVCVSVCVRVACGSHLVCQQDVLRLHIAMHHLQHRVQVLQCRHHLGHVEPCERHRTRGVDDAVRRVVVGKLAEDAEQLAAAAEVHDHEQVPLILEGEC